MILPDLAKASPDQSHCAELLRQGVVDFFQERSGYVNESDVRNFLLDEQASTSSRTTGGSVKASYGAFAGKVNLSAQQAEASRKLFTKDDAEIVKNEGGFLRDVRTISRDALTAFNQCLQLSSHGIQVEVQVNPDQLGATFTVRHGTHGSTSQLQSLQMFPVGAFVCRGNLAGMANTGGLIDTSALNMTCERKHTLDEKGNPTAPAATIVVETKQGAFRRYFTALRPPPEVKVEPPPPVPSGAVLAFDQESCPEGWEDFNSGAGRVVIGVGKSQGLTERKHLDVGGSETHLLTIDEMPAHDHGGLWGGGESMAGMNNGDRYHTAGHNKIRSDGGGKPHNNMPPFIALRLCRKL